MKEKNGYTTLQMLIVIGVLGIVTLALIGTTSYAYKDKSNDYYDEKVHLIIKQAELYGATSETLKNEGNLNITVNDLVKAGYFVPDDKEGNIIDPRNSKANLNGLRINLIYNDDGTVNANVIEEE